jgi:hypothetical protein
VLALLLWLEGFKVRGFIRLLWRVIRLLLLIILVVLVIILVVLVASSSIRMWLAIFSELWRAPFL